MQNMDPYNPEIPFGGPRLALPSVACETWSKRLPAQSPPVLHTTHRLASSTRGHLTTEVLLPTLSQKVSALFLYLYLSQHRIVRAKSP